jgi:CheY-like chemotaxis protein
MQWRDFRFLFGLSAALIIFALLVVHLTGRLKVDTAALGLVGGAVALLAFAFARELRISKITAFETTIEFAEEAAKAIPTDQRGQIYDVLRTNADLFPILGARILWVDDDPQRLIPHRQLLRRLGVQVISVTSTDKAKEEIKRDSDFALVIQDAQRNASHEDAKELQRWASKEGKDQYNLLAPLIVYSFDRFSSAVGVPAEDWITKDFGELLKRVARELRDWHDRIPKYADFRLRA